MTLKKNGKKSSRRTSKKLQISTANEKTKFGEAHQTSSGNSGEEKDEAGAVASVAKSADVRDSEKFVNSSASIAVDVGGGGGAGGKKLDRKPSLRRKFNALIRGGADLPAAINRGLQPIRRSLSFSKDINRVYETRTADSDRHHHARTKSAQWYNSLGSLAEHDSKDEEDECTRNNPDDKNEPSSTNCLGLDDDDDDRDDGTFSSGRIVRRTHSLLEKNSATSLRRRAHTVSGKAALYGRHSDHYDSAIDLSKPPFEASSLPVLTHSSIDEDEAGSSQR